MNLFDFLESRYLKTNLELQKDFSLAKQAETKATQDLIDGQRKWFKWCAYFKLLFLYALIKLHILKQPETTKQISERIKAEQLALIAAHKASQVALNAPLPPNDEPNTSA